MASAYGQRVSKAIENAMDDFRIRQHKDIWFDIGLDDKLDAWAWPMTITTTDNTGTFWSTTTT